MKGVVGFTPLSMKLREQNEDIILCYAPETNIVHIGHWGVIRPECGLNFKASANEVMYFNGGQVLDNLCPVCFAEHAELIKELAAE